MGEYIGASIQLGGKLPNEHVDELLELIADKRLTPDWGFGKVDREDLSQGFFASSEVNYGSLDELREFAAEHGLHYRYWSDSGPEWDASTTIYNPETGNSFDFVGGETHAIDRATAKELGSYEAILAYFEMLEKPLPPLEIV